jgi:hypothetical protein
VAPDGAARLLIDREQVATLAPTVTIEPDARWYVVILGRAADTHLYVRNLVLWEGMRY